MRELTWQARNAANPQRANWSTRRREETRQEYANARIQNWRRERVMSQMPVTFEQLLHVFVLAGEMYDSGCRLLDEEVAA